MAEMEYHESQPASGVSQTASETPRMLRWTAHPLRDFPPLKTMALALLIAGLLMGIRAAFVDWGWVLLGAVFLFAAMSKYLLPTHYEFTPSDVTSRHLGLAHRRPWAQFVTCEECRTGVFLSPFARRHPLENFRGLYVLFGPGNRDEVMAFVRSVIRQQK